MKTVIVLLGFLGSVQAALASGGECYQLSMIEDAYSRTPEVLCVQEYGTDNFLFTLKSGLPMNEREVARFQLNHLGSARCAWCNETWYGLENPSNSVFNTLQIRFSGKIDRETGAEQGRLWIGKNEFFYRKVSQ